MYKTILVPLDGSPRAERILPHVEELGHRFQAKIVFLQVLEPHHVPSPEGASYEEKRVEEAALKYLAGFQGEFREKGMRAKKIVEHGPVVETIINVAAQQDADLIAVASHGRGGISRVFYGSVAAGILQRVDRPLLIIRSRGKD